MNKIKEIHIFGTSFTAGGGYLWEVPEEILENHSPIKDRLKMLNDKYDEEPKPQKNIELGGSYFVLFGIKNDGCGYKK